MITSPTNEEIKSKIITMIDSLIDDAYENQLIFRQMLNILVIPIPFNTIKPTAEYNTMLQQDIPVSYASEKIFEQIRLIMTNMFLRISDSEITISAKNSN